MSKLRPESDRAIHVLFLCTGNSARSILAEAILNRVGEGRFLASSAGSEPKKQPHPLALETLKRLGYRTKGLRSKSWDEFATPESPRLDLIVTVCANAASETCPIWPGRPISAHWDFEDPAAYRGSTEEARALFEKTHDELRVKIRRLVALDSAFSRSLENATGDRRDRVERLGVGLVEIGDC